MLHVWSRCLSLVLFALLAWAAEPLQLWPAPQVPEQRHGPEAFTTAAVGGSLAVAFHDRAKSDNYTHLDFGRISTGEWRSGGLVEVVVSLDRPVLRLGVTVADPNDFWPTKASLEGEVPLVAGEGTYRFWCDRLPAWMDAHTGLHLFLMLHDLGGDDHGAAQVVIRRVALLPAAGGDWHAEKRAWYARQFRQPVFPRNEAVYREHLDGAVPWAPIASIPGLQRCEPTGWRRRDAGERTWDPAFLADTAPAQPGFAADDWASVTIPEAPIPDQAGGHRWYRSSFDLPDGPVGQVWLRCDDLCDWAEFYVNGTLVGTQTGVSKRLDWVIANGSRFPFMNGVSAAKALTWRHFDRCGIPWPFSPEAVPQQQDRLILPLGWGGDAWNRACAIGSVVKPGTNTLAVRLYSNPMRGWWIYRHPAADDRAAQNITGILAPVVIAWTQPGGITAVVRHPPHTVEADGLARHHFTVSAAGPASGARVRITCAGVQVEAPLDHGSADLVVPLPAAFTQQVARVTLIAANGTELDARTQEFHGTVIGLGPAGFLLNGEPFRVRGIGAQLGVDFADDRRVTRAAYVRQLDLIAALGFNAIRIEGAATWHLREAAARGLMALPVEPAASTDLGIQALGRFDDPDLTLATDRHRLLAIRLGEESNVLAWNIGNEIHHTPGYDDRQILETYLDQARTAVREFDPYLRPTLFANLDTWRQDWFFLGQQDLIGWNLYDSLDAFRANLPAVAAVAQGRPILFTEFGLLNGEKDRKGREDAFEADFAERWRIAATTPGVAGAFLFSHHGELEDQRGRDFLAKLCVPVVVVREGAALRLRNREVATLRHLRLVLAGNAAEVAEGELVAGAELTLPEIPAGRVIEASYETHHGLWHRYRLAVP